MNILLDRLPETAEICNKSYPIETDFRNAVLFELLMQDGSIPPNQKISQGIEIFFGVVDITDKEQLESFIEYMLYFYSRGKTISPGKGEGNKNKKIYSFEYDDQYIYSAFLSQYNIDLVDIEYLHWWKFRALFDSLDQNCMFSKIMGYRAMTISNKMTKDEKSFYRRMKRLYALPDERNREEKETDFASSLVSM